MYQRLAGVSLEPDRLSEIRRRYILDGVEPREWVPPAIVRSWQRSSALGLILDRAPHLEALDEQQLKELRERNELLLATARGEVVALFSDARATNGIVILADATGMILEAIGNTDFAEHASGMLLRAGVQWDEATIGTNAIGTAIAESAPIAVAGAEHFFDKHSQLGCSAVPIFDPSGRLMGVLDMSNDANLPQTHTVGLVRRAVDQIERRLFERRFGRHESLAFHSDPNLINSTHEGLLAFDGDRLVGANRQALAMLGLDWSALGVERFDHIFVGGLDQIRHDGPVEQSRLRTLAGSLLFGQLRSEPRVKTQAIRSESWTQRREPNAAPPFERQIVVQVDRAVRLADAGVPILIQGEVGAGKEIFARHLHAASRYGAGPFVRVDCSTEAATDIEIALFGAPPQPCQVDPQVLTGAPGGTLLLAAVEALPMTLQIRLAQALRPDRSGDPAMGGRQARDFNLVAITDLALRERVAVGCFSAELAVRLAAHLITLQPLRLITDRETVVREIWQVLAPAHLVDRLTEEAVAVLAAYAWPGNRRQLIATLRSLAVLADSRGSLGPEALPREIRDAAVPATDSSADTLASSAELGSITLAVMRQAVDAENGNISRAAKRLGVNRSTLYRRLLSPEQDRS
ncbi:MAG: sigma 54-interacting transcriptional regulator [Ancalomicrobiaceae bacterium]|nr:sigma 54-interacting transcriptional regulator [Ancalomicrobiaceae bacterium]